MFRATISISNGQSYSSEKMHFSMYFISSNKKDLREKSIEKFKNNNKFMNEISRCDLSWLKPLVQKLNKKYSFSLFCEQKKEQFGDKQINDLIQSGIKKSYTQNVNSDFKLIIDHVMNISYYNENFNESLLRLVENWLIEYFNYYKDNLIELMDIDIIEISDGTFLMEHVGHSE